MKNFKDQIYSLFQNDKSFEDAIEYSKEQIADIIISKRKQDLAHSSEQLKRFLVKDGRCPVCTLIIPCNHNETPVKLDEINTFVYPSNEVCYSPKVYISEDFSSFLKNHKKEKKRLKILNEIEKYKEEKFNKELSQAQMVENQKIQQENIRKLEDAKRKRHTETLKKKITEFKEQKMKKNYPQQKIIKNKQFSKLSKLKKLRKSLTPYKLKSRIEEIDNMLSTQMSLLC